MNTKLPNTTLGDQDRKIKFKKCKSKIKADLLVHFSNEEKKANKIKNQKIRDHKYRSLIKPQVGENTTSVIEPSEALRNNFPFDVTRIEDVDYLTLMMKKILDDCDHVKNLQNTGKTWHDFNDIYEMFVEDYGFESEEHKLVCAQIIMVDMCNFRLEIIDRFPRADSLLVPTDQTINPEMFGFSNPLTLKHIMGDGLNINHNLDSETVSAIDELAETLKNVKGKLSLDKNTNETLRKFSENVSNTSHDIKLSMDFGIGNIINLIKDNLPTTVIVSMVVLVAHNYMPKDTLSRTLFCGAIVAILALYLNSSSIYTEILKFFSDTISPEMYDTNDYGTLMASCLNIGLGVGSAKNLFSGKGCCDVLHTVSKIQNGSKGLVESLSVILRYIWEKIDNFFNKSGSDAFVLTGHAYVDEFLKETSEIKKLDENGEIFNDQGNLDRVNTILKLGMTVSLKIPSNKDWMRLRFVIDRCCHELEAIRKKLLSTNFKFSGMRSEPVSILLQGGPGVGKSNCMQHLAHALAARTFSKVNLAAYKKQSSIFIFNRQSEVKHWDGYDFNKKIVFFDDILQQKDVAGDPDNEIMNIVRAINCFEYQLHCAAMEMKGNTMMRADFIIANTNQSNFNFASINCAKAFMRRWDIVVVVCPKLEYSKSGFSDIWERKIDFDKVSNDVNASKMHPSNLEFHVQTMASGKSPNTFYNAGIVWSWNQLVDYAHSMHNIKKERHEQMIADLDKTLVDFSGETITAEGLLGRPVYNVEDFRKYARLSEEEFQCSVNGKYDVILPTLGESQIDDEDIKLLEYENFLQNADEYRNSVKLNSDSLMTNTINQVSELYIETNDIYQELKAGPYGDILEFCDSLDYQKSCRVKFFLKRMWFEVVFKYRIRVSLDYFCQIFLKYKMHNISKDIENIDPILLDQFLSEVLYKESQSEESSVFQAYLKTSLLENKLRVETADLPEWKKVLFSVYNWIIGFCAEAGRGCIGMFDSTSSILAKTVTGAMVLSRVVIAKVLIQFLSKWIFKTFSSIKRQFWTEKVDDIDMEPRISDKSMIQLKELNSSLLPDPLAPPILVRDIGEISSNSDPRPEKSSHHRAPRHKTPLLRARLKERIGAQSLYDTSQNLMDIAESIARKNLYEWWTPIPKYNRKGEDTHSRSGMAMGIVGSVIFVPYHFVTRLAIDYANGEHEDSEFVRIRSVYVENRSVHINIRQLLRAWDDESPLSQAYDIAIFNIPQLQPCRDITHLFATEAQIAMYDVVDAMICLPPKKDSKLCSTISMHAKYSEKSITIDTKDWFPYELERIWVYYNKHTGPGDCGAPLFVNDRTKGSLIIGMHMAGGEVNGFSSLLTHELVQGMLKEFYDKKAVEPYKYEDQLNLEIAPSQHITSNMSIVGTVSSNLGTKNSGRSKYIKSPLWGLYAEPLTHPARLKNFYTSDNPPVLIKPMEMALEKYCPPDPNINETLIVIAREQIYAKLLRGSRISIRKRIYSFDEAVLGNGPKFSKLPRVTSAGFPYNTMKGKTTKERFFLSGPKYDLNNPECDKLRNSVDYIIGKAKSGVRSTHIYTDFPKDERRPIEKWKKGITRLVSGSPIELTILFRMYFGAFIQWMYENSIENGCALDTNHNSRDWDNIVSKLHRFGIGRKNMGAGDYKNFDGSHNTRVQWAILDLIEKWYDNSTEEERRVRKILWYEVTNSLHLNGCMLMYWLGSLPSGTQVTPTVGDLMNHFNFHIIWMLIFGVYTNFDDGATLITRSDDHVYAVDEPYVNIFTEKRVGIEMAHIGYKYTSEDKTSELEDSLRGLDQITFLKRRFVWNTKYHKYFGPLDKNVVQEIPMWVKDGASSMSDVASNVNVAIEEAALHEPWWYDQFVPKLVNTCQRFPDIGLPVDWNQDRLIELVLNRKPRYDDFEVVYGYTNDINPESWLPASFNEFHDGKLLARLHSGRTWAIQPYCQDGSVAALPMSRSHDSGMRVAPLTLSKRATETKSQSSTAISDGSNIGQQKGSVFTDERTAESSEAFPPGSTTHAVNDADTVKTSPVSYLPPPMEILTEIKSGVTQEIRDFLAKPQVISSGVFSTTDTFSSFLWVGNIPGSIINSNPIWQRKIEGNYAIRAKITLTIQFNANRFQQGRYILAWVPDAGAYTTNRSLWQNMHSSNLCQVTQLPHVEFDLNCDTQAMLEIPQINTTGFSLAGITGAQQYGNGYAILTTYSPLISPTGPSTANWTLYAHFTEVDFSMPVIPQSSQSRIKNRVTRKKTPELVEQLSNDIGPLETMMSTLGTYSGSISGIPILSSIAGKAKWALDIGAKTASSFGWSKPLDATPYVKMKRQIFPKYNNADTTETGEVLGVMDKNSIEQLPGFSGNNLDELSISYISSIPAWYSTTTWSETDSSGTQLYSSGCSPRDFKVSSAYVGGTVYFPTPIAFVANFFTQWRGSIKFTVKIVKTEFHSGRLIFMYRPYNFEAYDATPVGAVTIANSTYLHREIFDIRFGNEFTFVIPWLSLTPYRPTFGSDSENGTIIMQVLNPLVAPANVSSTVQLLFEVSACDDFEVAIPRALTESVVSNVTPQVGEENVCEIFSDYIGNASKSESLAPARYCVGERVLSLRQLIKRFNYMTLDTSLTNSWFIMFPWFIFTRHLTAAGYIAGELSSSDVFSHVASCYAIARGSMRYKILDDYSSDDNLLVVRNVQVSRTTGPAWTANFNYTATGPTVGGFGNGDNQTLTLNKITGGLEATFPFYNRLFSYAVGDSMNNAGLLSATRYDFRSSVPRSTGRVTWVNNPTNLAYFRAAGEDFELGLFVSTPPLDGWATDL